MADARSQFTSAKPTLAGPDFVWHVRVQPVTAQILPSDLDSVLWAEAHVHWSGSRWDQSVWWLLTCLLPASAIQHLVERLISARLLFLQSGLLAHSEKKYSALYVEDLEAKLTGIFLSKPKVDIFWTGCCFPAFCASQGFIHGQRVLVYSFFLGNSLFGKKMRANVTVQNQASALALACPQIQGGGSAGWGYKSREWLGRSRGRPRPQRREPRYLTGSWLFLSQSAAGNEQMQGRNPFWL